MYLREAANKHKPEELDRALTFIFFDYTIDLKGTETWNSHYIQIS